MMTYEIAKLLIFSCKPKSACIIHITLYHNDNGVLCTNQGGDMRKSILKLLGYGWPDKIIANYLMIKPTIVKYYRKKYKISRNEYQGFY